MPVCGLAVVDPPVSHVSQDISTQVRSAPKSYRKIDKPPGCNLDVGKYHLVSQPEGEIHPKVCDARHRFYEVLCRGLMY